MDKNRITYNEVRAIHALQKEFYSHPHLQLGRVVIYKEPKVDPEQEMFSISSWKSNYKGELLYIGTAITGPEIGTTRIITPRRVEFITQEN